MNKTKRIVLFTIVMMVLIGMTIYFFPYLLSLRNEEARLELQARIDAIGFWGWLLMLFLQTAQVVIAFLPGEPVEILMGVMFGPVLGTLTCFLGIIFGTLIIFWLARTIGKPFISIFINPDKLNEYRFIKDKTKKDAVIFTLFLIPATPKDVITYVAPFVDIKVERFLFISLIARIPSIVSSTIFGASISKGNWGLMIIIFIATVLVGIIGLIINKKYMEKHNKIVK